MKRKPCVRRCKARPFECALLSSSRDTQGPEKNNMYKTSLFSKYFLDDALRHGQRNINISKLRHCSDSYVVHLEQPVCSKVINKVRTHLFACPSVYANVLMTNDHILINININKYIGV